MDIQLPEDFSGVQKMLVLEDPVMCQSLSHNVNSLSSLLRIECQQRQVQKQGDPVSVNQEQEGQEGLYSGFGHNVRVQAIAKINGVDVVTVHQRSALFHAQERILYPSQESKDHQA